MKIVTKGTKLIINDLCSLGNNTNMFKESYFVLTIPTIMKNDRKQIAKQIQPIPQ